MCPLGRCTLSPCHHTIPSCDKQWPCHLLTVGFLAFCFPQLLGRTGRALEGRAGGPLPFLAGFWAGWGLIPKPGDSASPCMTCHSSVPQLWAPRARGAKDFFLFPKEMNPQKAAVPPSPWLSTLCPFLCPVLSPVCAVTPKHTAPFPKSCPGTSTSTCQVGTGGAAPPGL